MATSLNKDQNNGRLHSENLKTKCFAFSSCRFNLWTSCNWFYIFAKITYFSTLFFLTWHVPYQNLTSNTSFSYNSPLTPLSLFVSSYHHFSSAKYILVSVTKSESNVSDYIYAFHILYVMFFAEYNKQKQHESWRFNEDLIAFRTFRSC